MTSIAKVMKDRNPDEEKYMGDYVHIVAGFSKDFGVSGYRTGTLFSHNEDLLVCMSRLGYFKTVSTQTQFTLTKILEDEQWTNQFIERNQQKLENCYEGMKDAFESIGAKVLPCQGTMMAWVDMSSLLKEQSFKGEQAFWDDLCNDSKIILTTGNSCFSTKPGMFRVCFSYPDVGEDGDPQAAMKELKKRLISKFGQVKQH